METAQKIEIKVFILPKFESGVMSGDFPVEAQYYYEEYVVAARSMTQKTPLRATSSMSRTVSQSM
ncbi:MAG: hypothetical protein ACI4S4_06315 [Candidatus Ornithospirochaeta sp.]